VRAPLSWIRDFTPVVATTGEIADALNQLGLEVEAIDEPGRDVDGVVVGRILDVVAHPDADRIQLADVDFGDGTTRVVCGAPNIYAGMVAPFAKIGASLPGGFRIERRKIRGVVSEGMLCSARELGLGDDHSGILELPVDAPLGSDVREVLGLDDVVFDLAITPNRPDAMGVAGVARDIAAHFGLPFDAPATDACAVVDSIDGATVVVEDPDRCPRLVARVARVRLGASPAWMQRRLTLAGMRPISNVVDVTNYVMLERARPLHAFDLGRMGGRGILVRTARAGERIVTLDGVERALTVEDLLICDAESSPQAIAGIMGGATAEVSEETREIILESAYFAPNGIARTSKRLGLRSEASARFERGVDPNGAAAGADLAMRLLTEVAGADAVPGSIDVYPAPVERTVIKVRTRRVNAILGTDLSAEELRSLISPLGIEVGGGPPEEADVGDGVMSVSVPTFRPDVVREIDVIEEVARRHGLQRIGRTVPSSADASGGLSKAQRDRRLVADVLVGAGCDEAFTLPLIAAEAAARFGGADGGLVEVENPLRAEESVLRAAILPGLLDAARFNAAHGNPDVALFEVGHVFRPPAGGSLLPDEQDHIAALLAGRVRRRPHEADRPVCTADAVALVEALCAALGLADLRLDNVTGAPGFHPARCAAVIVDGDVVGHVGEVEAAVLAVLDLAGPVAAMEIDLGRLLGAARRERAYRPLSRFPGASVDLAFVLPEGVSSARVVETLREVGADLLEDVHLFDIFRSEQLGAGRVSLAFALRFRSPESTLTDDEVAGLRQRCIDAVISAHSAELRA